MPFLYQSRFIRELRMGSPKTYKTGSICETYPTPMLVLQFDSGGCDVVVKRPVTRFHPDKLKELLLKPSSELPPICEIAYYEVVKPQITDDWKPQHNSATFKHVMWNINQLAQTPVDKLPFKLVFLDGLSRLQEFMLQYMPETTGGTGQLEDARKWAFSVGSKAMQIISTLYSLPCHVVVSCHIDDAEKNPVTEKVISMPLIYGSRPKAELGGLPSQFFYQKLLVGKPRLFTRDNAAASDYIKGIGARWPVNLPAELDPTFQAVYETEYK